MANLFYPQLSSGAVAQYPIRKTRIARTIKNILPDGSMILFSDPDGGRLIWDLLYTELSDADVQILQAHFNACVGPFHGFTFIDPTDNMLASSVDLRSTPWVTASLIQVSGGAVDPSGGNGAFTVSNAGQINQELAQTANVPSGYQYCFSIYAMSAVPSAITMIRRGATTEDVTTVPIGPTWTRVTSSGRLNDNGTSFTVAISLTAGQQAQLYGPQLEAQRVPSGYRPTSQMGGVYANAHWAVAQLPIIAEAPGLFSTRFTIETALQD
jgi:hypothetical protein